MLWVQRVFPAVQLCTPSPPLSPCSLGFGDVHFSLALEAPSAVHRVVVEPCADVGEETQRMWWLVWAFNLRLSFSGALLGTLALLSLRNTDDGEVWEQFCRL